MATVGTAPFEPADKGLWKAGTVGFVSYAYLTVDGRKVISEASCDFSFSGSAGNTKVDSGPQLLTLTAPPGSLLQKAAARVLRHDDSAQDQWGNTLKVVSSSVLTSE